MDGPQALLYLLRPIREFVTLGGPVLVAVLSLMCVMWTLILERLFHLHVVHVANRRRAVAQWQARVDRSSWRAHQIRRRIIAAVVAELQRHLTLIRTCVLLCPLLGLLGTVTGMIEVFDVLSIAGSGDARSMAAGISRATIPTMAGMMAALSGILMSVYLHRRLVRERARLSGQLILER